MTAIISVVTSNGIVMATDGRALDGATNKKVSDSQIKMYELSPLSVVMIAGTYFDGLDKTFADIASDFKDIKISNVSEVANCLRLIMQQAQASSKKTLLNDENVIMTFMVTGCDIIDPIQGTFAPKIIYLQKPDWDLMEPKPNKQIGLGGNGIKKTKDFIQERYSQELTIPDANILVLDAMEDVMKRHPKTVGGEIQLWNFTTEHGIERFMGSDIQTLRKKIV